MRLRPVKPFERVAELFKIVLTFLCSLVLLAPAALAVQQTPPGQAPPGQSEYVPIAELPPGDQMPAAPLLIAAYAFVWIAVMFYLWTIWRRLGKVEAEMQALAQKTPRR
jgi:CcmD family protein